MKALWIFAGAVGLCGSLSGGETKASAAEEKWQFRSLEVYVDGQGKSLAAYQLEISAVRGANVRIVGIEGGAHQAFREPPFYDPKAIQRDRVRLAAFSTLDEDQLPKGRIRVATIHYRTSRDEAPEFELKVETAASPDGREIAVRVEARAKEEP